jgi:rRNA maturation endonuclease Nob1
MVLPALVIGAVFFYNDSNNLRMYMIGGLSSAHKSYENRCHICHVPWSGVKNKLCYKCHQYECPKYEELTEAGKDSEIKIKCFDCHLEHKGSAHNLVVTEDTNIQNSE